MSTDPRNAIVGPQDTVSDLDASRECAWCGHENIPQARFCAKCGQTIGTSPSHDTPAGTDAETTSVFRPLDTASPEATWANAEAEQTEALPVQHHAWTSSPALPEQHSRNVEYRESARGFVLGIIATILIAAVIGYYVYAAWLSQSLRDDIAGWLP